MAPKWWTRALAAMWTLGVVAVTWMPAPDGPPTFDGSDKVVHLGGFGVFAVLWRIAGLAVPAVVIAGMALAVLTEVGQGWLPWLRTPDLADGVADMVGVAVGLGVAWVAMRIQQRRTPPA